MNAKEQDRKNNWKRNSIKNRKRRTSEREIAKGSGTKEQLEEEQQSKRKGRTTGKGTAKMNRKGRKSGN
jgi:hypothetical protein